MGVSVAEYFGQRTDVDNPVIVPMTEEAVCPFSAGNVCKKLKSHNAPVCSVRNSDGIACVRLRRIFLCVTTKYQYYIK